jgi:hypothetical protein
MAKKTRGRPIGSGKGLTEVMRARCTPEEKAHLEVVAADAGLDLSEYLRRAAAYCAALRVPLAHVSTGPLPPGAEVE